MNQQIQSHWGIPARETHRPNLTVALNLGRFGLVNRPAESKPRDELNG